MNLAVNPPGVVQYLEVPDISPIAMRHRRLEDGTHSVFIAGGTTGLWRVSLCADLLSSTSPPPCAVVPERIARAGCEATSVWKRCLDVAIVEGHSAAGSDPLVIGLFAASSDHAKRDVICNCPGDLGGTELQAWLVDMNGVATLYGSVLLAPVNPTLADAAEETGTALAVDPGDPDSVYVAVGRGGIRKVDISGPSFSVSLVSLAGIQASHSADRSGHSG